jgi:16S rRNA (cytidine1402-2'-O)-methyltransferase
MPGTLFVVATPIGNLDDITGRALRVLRDVSIVAAEDTRRTARLFARYTITTPTTSLHEHNESRKAPSLIARLARGDDVALVSDAGTPTISDPGERLVKAAIEAGIRVESVPGPSAILAALTVAGLPTLPFTFLGFPPVRSKDRTLWFRQLTGSAGTVVFFEAPHRIRRTLESLFEIVGDCEVAVCRELTKLHEEVLRGRLSMVKDLFNEPRGEYVVVANLGLSTNNIASRPPEPDTIMTEFGELTNYGRMSRREAITTLAQRYQLRPNHLYRTLEAFKKSGK